MKERIAVNPNVHFGKPCVAGTRVPVLSVLELVMLSFETIVEITMSQIEDVWCVCAVCNGDCGC